MAMALLLGIVILCLIVLIVGVMAPEPTLDIERRYGKYMVKVDGIQFVEQSKLDAVRKDQDELVQLLERWMNSHENPSRESVYRRQDLVAQTRVLLDGKKKEMDRETHHR